MYIRLQNEWDRIRGLFLDREHRIGTVKILTDAELASLPSAPDIEILRTLQFLDVFCQLQFMDERSQRGGAKCDSSVLQFFGLVRSPFITFFPSDQESDAICTGCWDCTKEDQQQSNRIAIDVVTQTDAKVDEKGRNMLFGVGFTK